MQHTLVTKSKVIEISTDVSKSGGLSKTDNYYVKTEHFVLCVALCVAQLRLKKQQILHLLPDGVVVGQELRILDLNPNPGVACYK